MKSGVVFPDGNLAIFTEKPQKYVYVLTQQFHF